MRENTDQKKLRIWTLFTLWFDRKIEKETEPTEQTIGWLVAFRQEISIVEFSLLPCFFCVKIYFIFLSVFSTRKFPNKVDWLNFPELELMY